MTQITSFDETIWVHCGQIYVLQSSNIVHISPDAKIPTKLKFRFVGDLAPVLLTWLLTNLGSP